MIFLLVIILLFTVGKTLIRYLRMLLQSSKYASVHEYFLIQSGKGNILADIYLFKVNNENTWTMHEMCSNLTIKTQERRQWRHSGVLLLILKKFHGLFRCFHCWLWTNKCWLGSGQIKLQLFVYFCSGFCDNKY